MNIRKLVLNDMPSNLNDLEKARYIYLKLAFILNFSTKFNNTSDKEFVEMYTSKQGINDIKYNQVICKIWARIYSSLITEMGIENSIINQGHEYVLFNYEGKIWIADATGGGNGSDLSNIRYGEETELFGICISQDMNEPRASINRNETSEKQLDKIDEKFDFYYKKRLENQRVKAKLKKIRKSNMSTHEKIEYMIKIIGVLADGYYESKDFVRNLEFSFLSDEELKNIHGVELKRTNKNKEVDIVQCICVLENEEYYYYILSPNLPITKVTKEEIIKLSILGYGLDEKNIPGIKYPRNFVPGVIDRRLLKYKIFRNFLPKQVLQYDTEQIKPIK